MAESQNNGFTAMRLMAAYSVILTHSYVMLGLPADWLLQRGFPQFSEFGVAAFFAISGYLIGNSLQRNSNSITFLRNRALRILPGLAAMLAVTVFVAAPLMTHEWHRDWLGYFWNLSLYKPAPFMSGVFGANPVQVVNGSLWTLPLEVTCYLMLLGVAWAGALNWRGTLLVFVAFYSMMLGSMMAPATYFMGFSTFHLVRLGVFFWGGAFLATVRMPRSWLWWVAAVVAIMAPYFIFKNTPDWHTREWDFYFLLPFAVVFAGVRSTKLAFLNRFDFSYGIYIYAFLIQQVLVARYGTAMRPITLSALTVLISTPVAAASWFLVEKPALSLKNRFRRRFVAEPA